MNRLFLLVSGFLINMIVFGQNHSLSLSVNKNSILIGEQFIVTIRQNVSSANESILKIDSIPHFEILNKSPIDTQRISDGLHLEQKITITSWDSGRWEIPSFHLGRLFTKPATISVSFSSFDQTGPYHDIKDIIQVKKPEESKWYWYVIGILFLAALLFLFFEKDRKHEIERPVSDEGAFKDAMKKLEKLRTEKEVFLNSKLFYVRLIDIFRDYAFKRKNIQSYSITTEDISRQLEAFTFPPNELKELVTILQLSDMVKYARYQTEEKENWRSLDIIKSSIVAMENIK